ncbi:NADH-ubiquinone oxidoreductase-F iron-sulfur binding region domain-containing protein [Halorubrum sp. Hd13]|uniref:NADH-ubiquinone oxidoreductase-F iron-sulfur binding region domain-containing protein n=1 Tax=Halorubrum sp. Hd13 TaxID=1480728 RepID=UPI000B99ABF8|nr:NADH dehydrogenase FAD-containing subunit [Halorubrum sp. Hd13]
MSRQTGAVGRSPVVRMATSDGEDAVAAARAASESVAVVRTGPTGIGESDPLVMATVDGRTAFFAGPTDAGVEDVVSTVAGGELPTDGADTVIEHEPGTETLPVPDAGSLSVGRRAVLGPCGWVDPLDPTERPFLSAERSAEAPADAGLLGRGRGDAAADDPVATEWTTAREADGDPVVVANANEAYAEQRADRTLLWGVPMCVLDGMAAVADRVGADDAVLYLNESDVALVRHLREAVDAASEHLDLDVQLVAGPDEHRAGAPTAALEAMEGADRIEPRLQPPSPAEHGLYGRPTVVHTPRTYAQVRHAMAEPDAFDPGAADPGTRLFTVTGDVAAPATVELPSASSLAAVREAVDLEGAFKMACVGDVLGGYTRDLDVRATAGSLRAADLGTGGVVELLDESRCALADAGDRATFAASENSGRCVPGREGTKQLAELLRDVYDGDFEDEKIRELGRVMRRSSNCRTGAHAPRPVTTVIESFGPEVRAHADGRCPAGSCTGEL